MGTHRGPGGSGRSFVTLGKGKKVVKRGSVTPWSQAWQHRGAQHPCLPSISPSWTKMLDSPTRQPGQDGAGVEKTRLRWGCGRAAAVLGINSTKITPWGKSRRKGAFCWLTDLPSVQALAPQPRGGSGATAACHSPRPRRCSAGTRPGCPAPRWPPQHPLVAAHLWADPSTQPLRASSAARTGVPEHPAPKPPDRGTQAPHTQTSLPLCSPKSISGPQGGREDTGCCPREVDGAAVRELCSIIPSLLPRATGKAGDASICPSPERGNAGTARHRHPQPSAEPLPRHNIPLCASGPLPPSLPPSSLHRFPAGESRTHVNAIHSRHSWGTRGTSRAGFSRWPSLRGKRVRTHIRKEQPEPEPDSSPPVCAGDPSPESWDGISTPRHQSSALPHGSPAAWPVAPPARAWMEKSGKSPPTPAQPAPQPLPSFYPITAHGAPAPTERGSRWGDAKTPLGSGYKASTRISKRTGRI